MPNRPGRSAERDARLAAYRAANHRRVEERPGLADPRVEAATRAAHYGSLCSVREDRGSAHAAAPVAPAAGIGTSIHAAPRADGAGLAALRCGPRRGPRIP